MHNESIQDANMKVSAQCANDDGSRSDDDSRLSNRKSNGEKNKARFFFNSDIKKDEDASRSSNVSRFSLRAMRDEVSSKLNSSSNERDAAAPTILEETGFELLPNCDDDGNSSITIARAEKDYLNRTPPLQTPKAKMKRIFKRKSKMEVITTIYGHAEHDDHDDHESIGTTAPDEASHHTLEGAEICRKLSAEPKTTSLEISVGRGDTQYHPKTFDSKDIDDNQWAELFGAALKMVDYFLVQQLEEEAKPRLQEVCSSRTDPIRMDLEEPPQQQQEQQQQQRHERWREVARQQSYKAMKKLQVKAKELPMKAKEQLPMKVKKLQMKAKELQMKANEQLPMKVKELPMKVKGLPTKVRALPMPKPTLNTSSIQKLIPRRDSFIRDRPKPCEIAFETPRATTIVPVWADTHEMPESHEVAMAIETFRSHAKRLGVNEMELMDTIQHDERSLATGFLADDGDDTVITYRTTHQHRHAHEAEEDETTVYTRATLETYAPTVDDSECSPYTLREGEENLLMLNLLDVFDYFFVP